MQKIMFSDKYGLTEAVLDRKKTQTRRICKNQSNPVIEESRYKVGETIAVARRYSDCGGWFFPYEEYGETAGWNNKMFVEAELMPHEIRITNIRIERLQDISDEDCLSEGIYIRQNKHPHQVWDIEYTFGDGDYHAKEPSAAFAALIDKISGKDTWNSNPLVYVYEFELVK